MKMRIMEITLLSLCLTGFAACSSQPEPSPDVKESGGEAGQARSAKPKASGAGSDEADELSATGMGAGAASATPGTGAAPGAGAAAAAKGATALNEPEPDPEPPPDPNAPTVRVFQVDGTDSVEISVDARHMKQNLSFDDAQCKIFFEVGADADKMSAETNFPLGDFTVKQTPKNQVFRHRLGLDAIATSFSFSATEEIVGSMQPRKATQKSTVIYKRPMGINIRNMMLNNQRLKFATVKPVAVAKPPVIKAPAIKPATATKLSTTTPSTATTTTTTPAKVNVTRLPAIRRP